MKKYHSNKVRIIAGDLRSRVVYFSNEFDLRPTADSVRERVFNWLGQTFYQVKILDLFSGSGIFAFESASRGCAQITAVEKNKKTYETIKKNKILFKLDQIRLVHDDAFNFLSYTSEKFNIIFLDPPYNYQEWTKLFDLLMPCLAVDALIYIESNRNIELPEELRQVKNGKSGQSIYALACYEKNRKEKLSYDK